MPRSAGRHRNLGPQTVPRAQQYARPGIAARSTMNRGELYYRWPSRWDRSGAPASLRDCLLLARVQSRGNTSHPGRPERQNQCRRLRGSGSKAQIAASAALEAPEGIANVLEVEPHTTL
jgi:hypothetical protein